MFYPEGKHYIPEVGILGLGPYFGAPYTNDSENLANNSRLLPKLKADGKVTSEFFSAHMGSAALNQPGSLILEGMSRTER